MDDFCHCDLCELNRATLHIDEVHEGSHVGTAHLCDDCWYRLGIRIPLGNILNHIRREKDRHSHPATPDPIPPNELIASETYEDEEDEEDELLDPGSLAVVEPDEHQDDDALFGDVEQALAAGSDLPSRQENLSFDDLLERLSEPPPKPEEPQLGIQAVRIGRIHPALVSLFPIPMLIKHKAIPIKMEEMKVTVALADPFDVLSRTQLEVYLEGIGLGFVQAIASETEILAELDRHAQPPPDLGRLS